jgi:acyl-homoserine lactone acylase PvdQ
VKRVSSLSPSLSCASIALVSMAAVGLIVAVHAPARADDNLSALAKTVTIRRDTFGVPHVYGPTDASCVFGFIYAQAEDYFWQIEDSYLRSLGRAAEVYGDQGQRAHWAI